MNEIEFRPTRPSLTGASITVRCTERLDQLGDYLQSEMYNKQVRRASRGVVDGERGSLKLDAFISG